MKPNELNEIRCYLVEDHPLIRSYLELVLTKHFSGRLVGFSDSAAVAREEIFALKPDLVLTDLSLRAGHGLELIKELRTLDRPPKILVLSGHDETAYAERALHAGASGYLNKSASPAEVIVALERILAGETYLSGPMAARIQQKGEPSPASRALPSVEQFSDRELEVFELMGTGYDTRQIAEHLGIEAKTVDTYRSRIKEKLGIATTNGLRVAAFQWLSGSLGNDETARLKPISSTV
ncbi:MAG TPA: response regulator transcription factor [Candidatus Limnocylindria bacterium]|jgi:DNA-binding NarL/FixJ family response regulator|nr:response regulator transcription factor [Candidatus Limnocylindria bacterium]